MIVLHTLTLSHTNVLFFQSLDNRTLCLQKQRILRRYFVLQIFFLFSYSEVFSNLSTCPDNKVPQNLFLSHDIEKAADA